MIDALSTPAKGPVSRCRTATMFPSRRDGGAGTPAAGGS